jgi:hypothetical protein
MRSLAALAKSPPIPVLPSIASSFMARPSFLSLSPYLQIIFFACFKPDNNKLSLTLTTVVTKRNKNQKFVTTTLKTKKQQLTITMSGKGKNNDDE